MRLHVLPLLLTALALAISACGGDDTATPTVGESDPAPAFETVSAADIGGRVANGEVLLVDVREDDEWRAGRAPRAFHVPLAEVEARLDEIEERRDGRPLAFICRSGRRSAEAAQIAVDGGLEDVVNVEGGMAAWVEAGFRLRPRAGRII
jgi:rhodanese-related sulfurtransferase